MKLYFENTVTAITTLALLGLVGFVGHSVLHRGTISHWGCRSAALLIFGLVVCCLAAARDGLDKTIQHAVDGACPPGLFPLSSVPVAVGCAGAGIIVLAAAATLVSKSQRMREIWFYVMSGSMLAKILTVEAARILIR